MDHGVDRRDRMDQFWYADQYPGRFAPRPASVLPPMPPPLSGMLPSPSLPKHAHQFSMSSRSPSDGSPASVHLEPYMLARKRSSAFSYAYSPYDTGSEGAAAASSSLVAYIPPALEAPPPRLNPFVLMEEAMEPRSYRLIIRQSPKHGQMGTLGSKERRILDPLPIVQLDIRGCDGQRDTIGQSSPFLVMQVNLIAEHIDYGSSPNRASTESASAQRDSSSSSTSTRNSPLTLRDLVARSSTGTGMRTTPTALLPAPHETSFSSLRLLEGKLTASAHIVRDVENYLGKEEGTAAQQEHAQGTLEQHLARRRSSAPSVSSDPDDYDAKACFFIFTDLSIRLRGTYRLHFSLVRLGMPSMPGSSAAGRIVAEVVSDPFPIHHIRDFAGMTESTPLAKSLANQGVHIPIRNESRWRSRTTQQQQSTVQSPSEARAQSSSSPTSSSSDRRRLYVRSDTVMQTDA